LSWCTPGHSVSLAGEQRCEQSPGLTLPDPLQAAWGQRGQHMGQEALLSARWYFGRRGGLLGKAEVLALVRAKWG